MKGLRQIESYFWFSDGKDEYKKGYYFKNKENNLSGPFISLKETKDKFKEEFIE